MPTHWIYPAEFAVIALESTAFLVIGYLLCRRHRAFRLPAMALGALCLAYRVLTSTFPDRFYIESPYLILTGLITPAGFLLLAAALTLGLGKSRQRILVGVFSVVLTYYVFCDAAWLVVEGPELAQSEGTWEGETMRQSRSFTCGPAAAATLLRAWRITLPEGEAAAVARTTFRGTEPPRLAATIRSLGRPIPLRVRIISTSLAELRALDRPAILFVRRDGREHVVTLLGASDAAVRIGDPGLGTREIEPRDLERVYRWSRRAIIAFRDPLSTRPPQAPPDPTLGPGRPE